MQRRWRMYWGIGTGYALMFGRLGFKTVAMHAPERPIMRHDLKGVRAMKKSAGE